VKAICLFFLIVPQVIPVPLSHPYQHPRLLFYRDGVLVYADVDQFGVVTGFRPREPWKPHPLDEVSK
jgi:hypothetical protein